MGVQREGGGGKAKTAAPLMPHWWNMDADALVRTFLKASSALDAAIAQLQFDQVIEYVPGCEDFVLHGPPRIDDYGLMDRLSARWIKNGERYGFLVCYSILDPPDLSVIGMAFRDAVNEDMWPMREGYWVQAVDLTGLTPEGYDNTSLEELWQKTQKT